MKTIKLKQIAIIFICALMAGFTASCSDDDKDNTPETLAGDWYLYEVNMTGYIDGKFFDFKKEALNYYGQQWWNEQMDPYVGLHSWSFTGNTMTWNDIELSYVISGNKIVLDDGDFLSLTYQLEKGQLSWIMDFNNFQELAVLEPSIKASLDQLKTQANQLGFTNPKYYFNFKKVK
ncbi:MAG: hypothetical protein LBR81_06210 [Prevotellaceae bacterium]|jgi:hypothetical protein|nr:hypothetical protein [Prevotellaceae bacterium]